VTSAEEDEAQRGVHPDQALEGGDIALGCEKINQRLGI
jgi:hypothetical protein